MERTSHRPGGLGAASDGQQAWGPRAFPGSDDEDGAQLTAGFLGRGWTTWIPALQILPTVLMKEKPSPREVADL